MPGRLSSLIFFPPSLRQHALSRCALRSTRRRLIRPSNNKMKRNPCNCILARSIFSSRGWGAPLIDCDSGERTGGSAPALFQSIAGLIGHGLRAANYCFQLVCYLIWCAVFQRHFALARLPSPLFRIYSPAPIKFHGPRLFQRLNRKTHNLVKDKRPEVLTISN